MRKTNNPNGRVALVVALAVSLTILLASAADADAQSFDWAVGSLGQHADQGNAVCIDPAGNSYVTGYFSSSPFRLGAFTLTHTPVGPLSFTKTKMFVAKLDRTGKALWAMQSEGDGTEQGIDIACDRSGHVVVVGSFVGGEVTIGPTRLANISKGARAVFIMRLSPDGNIQWVQKAGGKGQTTVASVSTGPQNDIYLTGSFSHGVTFGGHEYKSKSGNNPSVFVARYLPDGGLKWFEQIHGKGRGGQNSVQHGRAIFAHESGSVYVAGSFHGRVTFGNEEITSSDFLERGGGQPNLFIGKYDADGNVIWTKSVGVKQINSGPPPEVTDLTVDKLGSAYLTGFFPGVLVFGEEEMRGVPSKGQTWNQDVFVAKYDRDGNHLWHRSAGGTESDQSYAIAATADGVLIGGKSSSLDNRFGRVSLPGVFLTVFAAGYDADGKCLWAVGGKAFGASRINGVASHGTNAVVTGTFDANAITLGRVSLKGTGGANFFAAGLK
jgi:hypothetical protein